MSSSDSGVAGTRGSGAALARKSDDAFFIVSVASSGRIHILSDSGIDVSDAFDDVVQESDVQMPQWVTACADGRVAFWGQGAGIGFVDLNAKVVVAPQSSSEHIGDEFEGVCEAADGNFWICGADYGTSYGVVVDAAGKVQCSFGATDGGSDDDGAASMGSEDGSDGAGAPLGVASLPSGGGVVVSSCTDQLVVYNLDGTENRRLPLPSKSKSFGLCCVQQKGNGDQAPLIAVVSEMPRPVEDPAPCKSPPHANKRFRKVMELPTRHVLIINSVTGALVKAYKDEHLGGGRGDIIPVAVTALPDGSAAVHISEGSPLRIWPGDQGLCAKPLLANNANPASRHDVMMLAAVPATREAVQEAERASSSQ